MRHRQGHWTQMGTQMLQATYTRAYPFVRLCVQTIAVKLSAAHLCMEEPVLSTHLSRESSGHEGTLLHAAGTILTPHTKPFTNSALQLVQPGDLFVLIN